MGDEKGKWAKHKTQLKRLLMPIKKNQKIERVKKPTRKKLPLLPIEKITTKKRE